MDKLNKELEEIKNKIDSYNRVIEKQKSIMDKKYNEFITTIKPLLNTAQYINDKELHYDQIYETARSL